MDGSAMEEHQPLLRDVNNNGDNDSRQERGTNDDLEQGEVDSELPTSTGTWREWTAKKLEAPSTHKAIIILITIDACCVLADLVYTFLSPERDCSSSRPISPQGPIISDPRASTLIRTIVNLSYVRVTSNDDDSTSSPIWLTVLSHISLTITTLFLLEIPLALWCFGPAYYNPFPSLLRRGNINGKNKDKDRVGSGFVNEDEDESGGEDGEGEDGGGDRRGGLERRIVSVVKRDPNLGPKTGSESQGYPYPYPYPYAGLHLFDAFVVLTTFILEAILRGREAELAGLLILLRLWRLVKLVGGLAVGAGELQEELSNKLEQTERLLHAERARVRHLEDENTDLRSRLEGQIGLNKDMLVDTEVLEAV